MKRVTVTQSTTTTTNADMMVIGCEGDDEGEVPASLLQKYQLGKLLYKMGAVSVRRCEDRSDQFAHASTCA